MCRSFFPLLILFFFQIQLSGQANASQNPKLVEFDTFQGMVYDLPYKKKGKSVLIPAAYSKEVYSYDTIGKISLEEINIQELDIYKKRFPGIKKKSQFAMVLHSTMHIKKEGCYVFELNSDDGSILWINSEKIIDNDGPHEMQLKRDTFYCSPGKHDIKLWYFQGWPDRLGFIFNARKLHFVENCLSFPESTKKEDILKKPSFQLNDILFDTNKDDINPQGMIVLDSIANYINEQRIEKIIIIGHTDATGTSNYNATLSFDRASNIRKILRQKVTDQKIHFKVLGKGASERIDFSNTKLGRSKNRRVEILMH